MEKAVLFTEKDKLEEFIADGKASGYDRIYFGAEFCELRLPSLDDFKSVLALSDKIRKKLTVVTPYLTQQGIERVGRVLDFFHESKKYPELLIGDWGMLHFVPEKYDSRFPIVLGRILAKQRTGPRIELIKDVSPVTYESSKRSHLDVSAFIRLAKSLGVVRFELDWPLQGIDEDFLRRLAAEVEISLFYPWVYVSTTRRCPVRASGKCGCSDLFHEMKSKQMPVPLYSRGNSVFFESSGFPEKPEEMGFSRTVFQPVVP